MARFPWMAEEAADCMRDFARFMHDNFSPEAFRKLYSNTIKQPMNANEVQPGDIIHSSDDTIIKVHHIGHGGQVHFMAYADAARGRMGEEPYKHYYGFIHECFPATDEQKQWLEQWINEHKQPIAVNWFNARIERPNHLQRCLCWSTIEHEPKHRIYVYDDISKYWCTQGTTEHDPNGDNHISDYACYHITHWIPVTDIQKPEDL